MLTVQRLVLLEWGRLCRMLALIAVRMSRGGDVYLKCGTVDMVFEMFDVMEAKNVVACSAMIGELAINSHGKQALQLFNSMKDGVSPSKVTSVGFLNAYSRCGFLDDGLKYVVASVYGLISAAVLG